MNATAGRPPLTSGPLDLHPGGCYATLHGRTIRNLSRSEFDVLYVPASRPGRACCTQRLIDATEGRRISRMPILIQSIRRKLGDDRRQLIVSVRGRGYAYVPPRVAS